MLSPLVKLALDRRMTWFAGRRDQLTSAPDLLLLTLPWVGDCTVCAAWFALAWPCWSAYREGQEGHGRQRTNHRRTDRPGPATGRADPARPRAARPAVAVVGAEGRDRRPRRRPEVGPGHARGRAECGAGRADRPALPALFCRA